MAQGPVPPIVIETTTAAYDAARNEAAYMVADAWGQLGLSVTVRPNEFPDLIARVYQQQDFDAAILGWSGRVDRLDPQFFLGLFDSRQVNSNNTGGYVNPAFDALYDAQARTLNPEERRALVYEAQAVYAADAPLVTLLYRDELVAYNTETFAGLEVTAGDGLYSDWNLMRAKPLTERATLRIGGPQAPDNLNPLASTSVWGWKWMRMYYDTLVRLSPEAGPVLWAAEDVTVVDSVTFDVTLREAMTFHDGMPVTPDDVAFSFNYFNDEAFAYFEAYLSELDVAEVRDADTIRFTLRSPSASFATTALSQIPILPSHIWSEIETPGALARDDVPTVGSGPYRFDHHRLGQAMGLQKFTDHFHASEIALEGVEFSIFSDTAGMVAALIDGEIDFTAWQIEGMQADRVEDAPGLAVVTAPDFGFQHLTYNTRRRAFADPAFRRALTHAVDRQRIVDVMLEGRAQVGSSVIAPVNAFWHNPDIETFPFDMEEAFSMLEAAGYGWDAEGRLTMPQ